MCKCEWKRLSKKNIRIERLTISFVHTNKKTSFVIPTNEITRHTNSFIFVFFFRFLLFGTPIEIYIKKTSKCKCMYAFVSVRDYFCCVFHFCFQRFYFSVIIIIVIIFINIIIVNNITITTIIILSRYLSVCGTQETVKYQHLCCSNCRTKQENGIGTFNSVHFKLPTSEFRTTQQQRGKCKSWHFANQKSCSFLIRCPLSINSLYCVSLLYTLSFPRTNKHTHTHTLFLLVIVVVVAAAVFFSSSLLISSTFCHTHTLSTSFIIDISSFMRLFYFIFLNCLQLIVWCI